MEGSGGNRAPWSAVPASVRDVIERALGDRVVSAVNQPGGFSPGLAARTVLASGRRVFIKAVSPALSPGAPGLFRREAVIAARLPAGLPTPRLLWTGEEGDWVVLVFEDIEGHTPPLPWDPDTWWRVQSELADLADALTPSPIAVEPLADRTLHGWRSLAADPRPLDDWCTRNLDRLADLESCWTSAGAGDTLLHNDLRADNMILTDTGVVVVDWPHAALGAPWVDLVAMVPSVVAQGGPSPEEILARCRWTVDAEALTSVVAAVAGYFVHAALQPPPVGLPRLREFQRAKAGPALGWLRRRLGQGVGS
ncbi:phosphotransferase family protein [Actinokineospora terrae]|uniref:Predicted kinase, aminoglycoside phosphotransferase (APT) family n=1 Tax=Actinokineospora terrae TaxID=155974 RepID=A0A1H9XN85_9PSEU|nr:phosphotransferase [Actinokineospora terrae]SES47307.1 Predicted kinase, aminoglycoside phosphotransferase (APT) family [Actinokineospora terrae]